MLLLRKGYFIKVSQNLWLEKNVSLFCYGVNQSLKSRCQLAGITIFLGKTYVITIPGDNILLNGIHTTTAKLLGFNLDKKLNLTITPLYSTTFVVRCNDNNSIEKFSFFNHISIP